MIRRTAGEVLRNLEARVARLEGRKASIKRASRFSRSEIEDMLESAYVFHEYPEVNDAQNIIDALGEMMESGRVVRADLDRALEDLDSLSDRFPLERSTAKVLDHANDILRA